MAGLRFDVNCSILFQELPLLQRPVEAAVEGFDAVEFWWPFAASVPADAEVRRFIETIEDSGVQLVALNFAAGDLPSGDRGLVSLPARSREFRDSVEVAVGIGSALGVRRFNALYGNRVEGVRTEEQDALAVENLAFAADVVMHLGATVLVEPLSGAPLYPIKTAADALRVVRRVHDEQDVSNLRILADLYHLAVNEVDIDAVIAGSIDMIGHVQLADSPGRHEPGTGELAIDRFLALLEATAYDGWVGLEYLPSTSSADSFGWMSERSVRR